MMRAAVFLDRDGTINEEIGYLSRPQDLALIPGAAEAIRRINRTGMAVVVVTNQSGVARGYFDEAALLMVHARLRQELEKEGAFVEAIYYCPHHPDGTLEKYRLECRCRKPATGMLDRAVQDLSLDLSRSYMVGDHLKDVLLGKNGGMRSVLLLTGHGREEYASIGGQERPPYHHLADDLAAAVDWILRDRDTREGD